MNIKTALPLLLLPVLFSAQSSFGASTDVINAGEKVFDKWCGPCHNSGPNHPGTATLQARYQGALPAPLKERTDLTPELVRTFVRQGVSIMPFFRKTEISDADLAALAAYLARNSAK